MEYRVNDQTLSYYPLGEKRFGDQKVLLNSDVDLTLNTAWCDQGFTIEKLFPEDVYSDFKSVTTELLKSSWTKAGITIPQNFVLDQYHRLVNDYRQHIACVNETKLLDVNCFPGGVSTLEDRISEICGSRLVVKNPYDNQSVFHFRVIRPGSIDNNPLHRDVWLEDYEGCINLYIPIAGSNEKSSLIILPQSHRWPESKVERTVSGATINGVKFNVPAVTAITGDYTIVRPDPQENEVLVFSPYLIHGGAVNLNEDKTRISIEVRLWRK